MSGDYGVIPVAAYRDICDAVREKTHTDALMLPPEVAAKIRSINPTPGPSPTPGEWVRPEGWPDLDSIDLTGFDGVYLTYDLSKTEGYGWIGLYATTADRTSWTVERGHLEDGQFVAERTEQVANNGYFREPLDNTYGTIQLWRVSAPGHITELKFVSLTATSASNMYNNLQPCVERAGRLPYVVDFDSGIGTSQGDRCCGTMWMQHDKLLDVSSVTSLKGAWLSCYSLQSLNLSGWGTGSADNMAGAWMNCYSLQSLDLSGWDVSSVTNLNNAWQSCYSLQSLNLSGWDVSRLSTNVAYPNGGMLIDYWPSVISINQNYNSAAALSIASLLRIIDSLPVVTGTRTLTLGKTNKLKLTAEQIAVATQKGWTVA